MNVYWTIAVNTFRENRRDRVLYVLLMFAGMMIMGSVVIGELSVFEQSKILLDLGQMAMALFGSLIAIFLGIGLVSKEIERRTIYVIVSKPVSRTQFLLGKVLGLTLTLTVATAIMGLILGAVVWVYGTPPTVALAQSMVLLWVQLVLLISIAVTFASFTTTTLAAMFTFGTWIIGMISGDLKSIADRSESLVTKTVLSAAWWLLPNLGLLDAKARATYGIRVPAEEMILCVGYGLAYSIALLCLASIIFNKRDFR